MRLGFVVVLIAFSCSVAWAAVYEWVDSKGVLNMTDNPELVPEKYRKVLKTREIDISGDSAASPAPDTRAPAEQAPGVRETESYGGHDEAWWRNRFAQAKGRIDDFQEQIEKKKSTLEEIHRQRVLYQRPSDRVAYFQLADEIAKDEETVKALKKNLADLTFQADGAAVPLDWR